MYKKDSFNNSEIFIDIIKNEKDVIYFAIKHRFESVDELIDEVKMRLPIGSILQYFVDFNYLWELCIYFNNQKDMVYKFIGSKKDFKKFKRKKKIEIILYGEDNKRNKH